MACDGKVQDGEKCGKMINGIKIEMRVCVPMQDQLMSVALLYFYCCLVVEIPSKRHLELIRINHLSTSRTKWGKKRSKRMKMNI